MTPVRMPLIELGSTMRADGLPAGGADVPAGFAEGRGHAGQRFLGAGDDHRQGHDRQGQRGGEDRVAEPGGVDEGAQAEQGVHDAGHARQVDDRQIDEAV